MFGDAASSFSSGRVAGTNAPERGHYGEDPPLISLSSAMSLLTLSSVDG